MEASSVAVYLFKALIVKCKAVADFLNLNFGLKTPMTSIMQTPEINTQKLLVGMATRIVILDAGITLASHEMVVFCCYLLEPFIDEKKLRSLAFEAQYKLLLVHPVHSGECDALYTLLLIPQGNQ